MYLKKYSSLSILIIAVFILSACNALGLGVDYDATSNAINEFEEELEDFEDELKDWEDELQETQAALSDISAEVTVVVEKNEEEADVAEEPIPEPTQPPLPAATTLPPPTPTQLPMPELASGAVIFEADFTDFPDSWVAFGENDTSDYEITTTNGVSLTLHDAYDYIYAFKDIEYDSSDIRIDATVELLEGTNYTKFYLFCRDNSTGSYGFMLDTGGYWSADYWDNEAGELIEFGYGGSVNIKTGKAVNIITVICAGDQFTFLINGVEVISFTDESNLMPGDIGFEVSLGDIANAKVKIHDLTVTVP